MAVSNQPFTLKQTLITTGIILVGLCVIITIVYERFAEHHVKDELRGQIQGQMGARETAIIDNITKQRERIRFIHSTPPIQGIVRATLNDNIDPLDGTRTNQWITRLQTIFEAYIENNPDIYQIRYIGAEDNGKELVRIERRGTNIVKIEGEQLQQKGQTTYFQEITKYNPQQVYISNITLNREFGRIQVPHTPTQRVAMPIFDSKNTFFGLVIININAGYQLEQYSANLEEHFQLYLLNSTGGYIISPNKSQAFQFEFDASSQWSNHFKSIVNPVIPEDYYLSHNDLRSEKLYYLTRTILLSSHEEGRTLALKIGVSETTIHDMAVQRRNTLVQVLAALITIVFGLFSVYQVNLFNRFNMVRDQAEYEAIIAGSSDGIVAMTEDGTITSWNSAAEIITGYPARAAIGHKIDELLLKHSNPGTLSTKIHKVFEGQTVSSLELHATTSTGNLIDLSISLSAITLESGAAVGVAGIVRDITEQKILDKKLIELNSSLEKKVDARTKELEAAKNIATKANEVKSEFIANISHEIRTPMNGVLGMLQLLRNEGLTGKQRHHLDMATFSARNLTRLINDILDMSKIEAGKLDIESSEFNLLQMLSDAATSLAIRAQSKELDFILDTSEVEIESVKGDALRINQIITNLVSNALKFTNKGEIIVHAKTLDQGNSTLLLRCYVQDSGKGIAKEKLGHLFDSFTQEDSSITKNYGGTGLGLTICRQLCHLMGGNIGVTSKEGQGSKFAFEITLKHGDSNKKILTGTALPDKKILIASPNLKLVEAINAQLKAWKCTTVEVYNGAAVLANIEKSGVYSECIIDVNIGDESIRAIHQHIEANKSLPQPKLFLVCPAGTEAIYPSTFTHISKPVTAISLFQALTDQLATRLHAAEYSQLQGTVKSSLEGYRILLVDDNAINLEVGLGLLEEFGIEVTTANSGGGCLTLLHQADPPFDLVLMDCQMPEMDGYTTTQKIRYGEAGHVNRNITIIAMTAHAMSGARETCLQAGMDDYIPKPIDPILLEAKLEKWLSSQSESQEPKTQQRQKNQDTPQQAGSEPQSIESERPPNTAEHPMTNLASPALPTPPVPNEGMDIDEDLWNMKDALNRVRGKPERLNKLIAMFMESMPQRIERLEIAVHELELATVTSVAHEIKGVASNLSCVGLADSAAQLELAASLAKPGELNTLLEQTKQAFDQVSVQLQNYIDRI